VQVHATPLDEIEPGLLLDQRPELAHLLERDAPPADLARHPTGPEVWSAMRRWWPVVGPAIDAPAPALVHGDFWPGNTLWRYGRLTGVIDWEQPRRGNPAQDVASCRLDHALLFGDDAPAMFLGAYEAAAGRSVPHLFFWDLYQVTWALGGLEKWVAGYHDLGRTDLAREAAWARLERFAARALLDAKGGPGAV
jgi:aminoglycoside phosphotransferase (APT) family kinase protein